MDALSRSPAFDDDPVLVAGLTAHQPDALLELYDRYFPAAYALAARMLADPVGAEDCTHAAFLEVWRHPPTWEPTGVEFSAWLLAAVHRHAHARQRAAGADKVYPTDPTMMPAVAEHDLAAPSPHESASPARTRAMRRLAARQQRARAALAELQAAERAVLELAYLDGMTAAEIAAHLREPLAAVQNRIRAGVEHLSVVGAGVAPAHPAGPVPALRDRVVGASSVDAGALTHALSDETGPEYRAVVQRLPAGLAAQGAVESAPHSRESLADQEREQLLLLVGHELKTPITVIKATIQVASRRLRGDGHLAEAAHLDKVDAQVDHLIALVEYLLRAGQRGGAAVDLRLARFNLADLAREVCAATQVLSTVHMITVEAPEHLEVEGDSERLAQVLRNLITNAIKYSPAGGVVDVTLGQVDDMAELCVRDYGIGIPAAERTLVFGRFHRASNVGDIPGFGLGLALSQDIVRAHQGRLWVGDPPGTTATALPGMSTAGEASGSLLCLVLPLVQAARS